MTPSAGLVEMLEARTRTPFPSLIAGWAMTPYVDERLTAAQAGPLEISSWDLVDVFGARDENARLVPDERGFASFALSGTIIGGGTRYLRIVAGGAHGPLTLRVRDAEDRPLGTELAPRLWVVRLQ